MRALMVGLCTVAVAVGGQIGSLESGPARAKQFVSFTAEPQVIAAGKRSVLELRFRVSDGFHVNSHTPKSDLLIPTLVALNPVQGLKVEAAEYPAGTTFSFSFDPGEKLEVYQGYFTVRLPVVAAAGEHELKGSLNYQACDRAACFPPRTLPIDLLFTAK